LIVGDRLPFVFTKEIAGMKKAVGTVTAVFLSEKRPEYLSPWFLFISEKVIPWIMKGKSLSQLRWK
jgi:hypothetical protein